MLLLQGSHEVALKPLGDSDGAQLKELVELLERRLAGQKAFLPNEMEKLRWVGGCGRGGGQAPGGGGEKRGEESGAAGRGGAGSHAEREGPDLD